MTQTFNLQREYMIDDLQIKVEEFIHPKTQARHIHFTPLNPHNQENVFMVALNTIPQDDSGIAHILEHSVLCGSEKYPGKDPFFSMTRRSVSTFMNAFTGSGFTAYPFATQDKSDFNNLLSVYLDSVFFSRIDRESFLQEGWHLKFEQDVLKYNGVVYNEMKGANSSSESEIYSTLNAQLLPGSTYQFNSGGTVAAIPTLSYERLKAFYDVFYHPSNATFMTYGTIPALEHQTHIEKEVLHRFEYMDITKALTALSADGVLYTKTHQPVTTPLTLHTSYSAPNSDAKAPKNQVLLGWVTNPTSDFNTTLKIQILQEALFGSSGPLQFSLEANPYGEPSAFNMVSDDKSQVQLFMGLQNVAPEHVEAAQAYLWETLKRIQKEGIPSSKIQEILTQFDMSHRNVQDGTPYGLQLMFQALHTTLEHGDIRPIMDFGSSLRSVRDEVLEAGFVSNMIETFLLNNPHRIQYVGTEDTLKANEEVQRETHKLQRMQDALTPIEREAILSGMRNMENYQNTIVAEGLPTLNVQDLSVIENRMNADISIHQGIPIHHYPVNTNGIIRCEAHFSLPPLSEYERKIFPFYCHLFGSVGTSTTLYQEERQHHSSQQLHSLMISNRLVSQYQDPNDISTMLVLKFTTLNDSLQSATQSAVKYWDSVRFDDYENIKGLLSSMHQGLLSHVSRNGSSVIDSYVTAPLIKVEEMVFHLNNLSVIPNIKQLLLDIQNPEYFTMFSESLLSLHQKIQGSLEQVNIVGGPITPEQKTAFIQEFSGPNTAAPFSKTLSAQPLPEHTFHRKTAIISETPVNCCVNSYASPLATDPDLAAAAVTSRLICKMAHEAIREKGGAYCSFCSYAPGIFKIGSAQDPRLLETLSDIEHIVTHLKSHPVSQEELQDAILQSLKGFFAAPSPAGEAFIEITRTKRGVPAGNTAHQQECIKKVTAKDVTRILHTYFNEPLYSAVFTSEKNIPTLQQEGFFIQHAVPSDSHTPKVKMRR